MNIPTLDGPNWGTYSIHLQATTEILEFWELIKGEALGTSPQTYNLLPKPTSGTPSSSHLDAKEYVIAKAHWSKRNSGALGLLQATVLPATWQDFLNCTEAHLLLKQDMETWRGGGNDLPPIGQYGENSIYRLTDLLPQIQGQLCLDNTKWP